jgi:YVTN family beta-propeller protein
MQLLRGQPEVGAVLCLSSWPGKWRAARRGGAPTPAPETGFVYTADEKSNSVSVIDLASGLVKTVGISIRPHNVQVSRDGRSLLLVGMPAGMKMSEEQAGATKRTSEAMQRGRLLIFDAATMNADGAADIEVGHEPAHAIIDAQGKSVAHDSGVCHAGRTLRLCRQ